MWRLTCLKEERWGAAWPLLLYRGKSMKQEVLSSILSICTWSALSRTSVCSLVFELRSFPCDHPWIFLSDREPKLFHLVHCLLQTSWWNFPHFPSSSWYCLSAEALCCNGTLVISILSYLELQPWCWGMEMVAVVSSSTCGFLWNQRMVWMGRNLVSSFYSGGWGGNEIQRLVSGLIVTQPAMGTDMCLETRNVTTSLPA